MISIKRSSSRVSGGATTGSQRTAISQSTKTMTKCGKCCYYFRQVTTFLFSHIGLGTLLLGYALMGAFTFQALESDHEQLQREQMRQTRDLMIMELSEMTNRSAILKFENWTEMTERILRKFEMKFLDAVKHQGYDGNEEMAMAISQWSFSGALLYSIIVITTIGYGNVAPRTHWGKIVTILYAIIGIPLMLFCLSNIGHTMAHSFKFIYWKCCCYLCVKPKKAQRKKRRRIRRKIRKHRRNQRNQAAAAMMIQTTQSPMYMAPREEVGNYHQPHSMRASIPLKHSHSFNHNSNLLSSNLDLEKQRKPSPFLIRSLSNRSTINMDAATATATATDTSSMVTSVNTTPRRSFATDPAPMVNDNENHIIDGGLQLPQQSNYHFNNSNTLQLPQQPPQMQRKSPILARSLSARYHNELSKKGQKPPKTSKPQPSSTVMIKNQSNQTMKPYRKTTMNVPPVICNKYASNSDEFIDIVYQFDPEETRRQLKTIQKQQQQSMVRFQPTNSSMSLLDSQQQVPFPGIFPRGTTVSSSLSSANIPSHHREFRRSISVFESPASLNAAAPPPSPKSLAPQQQPPSFEMNNIVNTCPVDGPGVYQPFPLLLNDDHDDYSDLSESFDSDSSDDSDIQEKNIPITVCLTLVISYICGGAWFFSASEEWTFLDASYFCFITLSTIGFGDLVPGRTVLSTPEDGQMTLAICALYLLFGMALLAMSLNLVKEKVLETVRIIGERVGILVNDEDEDNY